MRRIDNRQRKNVLVKRDYQKGVFRITRPPLRTRNSEGMKTRIKRKHG